MSSLPEAKARPLSPHLQIYKPQLTSALSVFHRLTGIVLSFATIIFVLWLLALAGGADSYATFIGYAQSWFGQLVLFGCSLAFFYHLCCGVRHLLWDAGYFLEITSVYNTGKIAIIIALLMTLALWLKAYGVLS